MTLKKRTTIKAFTPENIPALNDNLDTLFTVKAESRWARNTSEAKGYAFQSFEHGFVNFSANGSAITTRTFALVENKGTIIYACANAMSEQFRSFVTDVTNSHIIIGTTPVSQTDSFSSVTTATVRVFFQVVGSDT